MEYDLYPQTPEALSSIDTAQFSYNFEHIEYPISGKFLYVYITGPSPLSVLMANCADVYS